jgi:hypothetical protein
MGIFLKMVIACFIAFMPQLLKADVKLVDWLLFSDKAYAKKIEVKAYILTERQSADLLADPSKEPIQLLASELAKFPKKYLVVRVKNLGDKNAWGTLACSVPRVWDPIKIPVINIRNDFCNYLICLEGSYVAGNDEIFIPKITFEWDKLYTK